MIKTSIVERYEQPFTDAAREIVREVFEQYGYWDGYLVYKCKPVYGSFWYCVFPSLVNEIMATEGENTTRKFINDLFTRHWRETQDETGKWVVKFQT